MAEIAAVKSDSLATEIGLETGDKIISVNDEPIRDYIDFQYKTADNFFTLSIKKQNGNYQKIEVKRNFGEKFGLEFNSIVFDQLKTCNNDCIFCFLKQSPPDLRSSLQKNDDDYRFSFLQGSFITLTNISEREFERIINLRLSPLNISVHTTNPGLRQKMMNNSAAAKIMELLKRLVRAEISFNTQVVLCPGINDGDELDRTIRDLSTLNPALNSLGVVPVGLTKFRENCYPIQPYTLEKAKETLGQIISWQEQLRKNYGQNWLYAADEFYLLGGKKIPEFDEYNDFPQIENGIGLTRLLWSEFTELKTSIPAKIFNKKKMGIVTGELGKKVLAPIVREFNKVEGLKIKLIAVKNEFFGPQVTVAGLLTGSDILTVIKEIEFLTTIIIPGVAVNDEGYFLDDMTVNDIKAQISEDKKLYLANNLKDILEVIKD